MDWQPVGKAISPSAPMLGEILMEKDSLAASGASALIAATLNCENDPQAILDAIRNNASALQVLKETEVANMPEILKWKTAQIEADAADFSRGCVLSSENKERARLYWLSLFLFMIAFGLEASILFFGSADTISGELVGRVMGTVDTMAVMLLTYWFSASNSGQGIDKLTRGSRPQGK